MSSKLKREVIKKFKRLGLTLKKAALLKIIDELHTDATDSQKFNTLLCELGDLAINTKLINPIITVNVITPCINKLKQKHSAITVNDNADADSFMHDTQEYANEQKIEAAADAQHVEEDDVEVTLQLLSSFDLKKHRYKRVQKQFMEISKRELKIHGNAMNLCNIFRDRYEMLLQKLMRHDLFNQSTFKRNTRNKNKNAHNHNNNGSDSEDNHDEDASYELTTTAELVGSYNQRKCVFGMLCELKSGHFFIQDTHGMIEIHFAEDCQKSSGLFTLNCFVLCEGTLDRMSHIFLVDILGMPQYERRSDTLKIFKNLNFVDLDVKPQMLRLERERNDECFVFISNLYLDMSETFEKLHKLFTGYSSVEHPPSLFVFMGNYTSSMSGSSIKSMKYVQSLFDKLCAVILEYKNLCEFSDFVFICGPKDRTNIGNVLPQPPILSSVVQSFLYANEQQLLHSHFQSNPFRIRYCTQEVVVFREDLLQKFRRNCVIVPELSKSNELSNHLCKTILDQSCLMPLPNEISPMVWNFAQAFNLYPAPDIIVLGDTHEEYQWNYEDCVVCCPGNFSMNGSFIMYTPHDKRVDFSKID